MARKISNLVLAIAVVVIGVIGFNNLRYLERSVWIFTVQNQESFGRGGSRVPPNANRENPPERLNREQAEDVSEDRNEERNINERDSSSPATAENRINPRERQGETVQRSTEGERGGRGDVRSRNTNNIRLTRVGWFTAVFALFAVLSIYIDRGIKFLFKKKK